MRVRSGPCRSEVRRKDRFAFEKDESTSPMTRKRRTRSGEFWHGSTRVKRISARLFLGKVSPVHFFWGSFDLAVTRFSGRPHRRVRARTGYP